MKPWEETWVRSDTDTPHIHEGEIATCDDDGTYTVFEVPRCCGMDLGPCDVVRQRQRAELAAAAPDLYRALASVEWSGYEGQPSCPACDEPAVFGCHAVDCALNAALKRARGEVQP